MRSLFVLIIIILSSYLSASGQSLLAQVDSLKVKYTFYEWESKDRICLTTFGNIERRFPHFVFLKVEVDKTTGFTTVEGFVNDQGVREDSFGLCCFDILVASAKKSGKLSNIRRFGETLLASDENNNSGLDGFFKIYAKFRREDVLLIGTRGTGYWGAAVVPLGKALIK